MAYQAYIYTIKYLVLSPLSDVFDDKGTFADFLLIFYGDLTISA